MKKILLSILVFAMVLSLASCGGTKDNNTNDLVDGIIGAVSDALPTDDSNGEDESKDDVTPVEDFEWEEVTGGIEITAYNGDDKRVVVPEVINNKKVVAISERPCSPFDGNVLIEELVLPKTINRVNITGCDNLRYLEMRTEELETAYCTGWKIPESVEELVLPNITVFGGDNARGPGDCFIPENSKLTKLVMPKVTGFALSSNASSIEEIVCADGISYVRYIQLSNGESAFPFFCVKDDDIRGENKALIDLGEKYLYYELDKTTYCDVLGVNTISINGTTYSK